MLLLPGRHRVKMGFDQPPKTSLTLANLLAVACLWRTLKHAVASLTKADLVTLGQWR